MKYRAHILIYLALIGLSIFAGFKIVEDTKSHKPVVAKGKPRFHGLFIAWPDGGYVMVADSTSFLQMKSRVQDRAILREFNCWTNTNGKTRTDEYNSTEDWTFCKTKTVIGVSH